MNDLNRKQIYTPEEVDLVIGSIAEELNDWYQGKNVLVVPIMTGAIVFAGKLLPLLTFDVDLYTVRVARYRGSVGGTLGTIGDLPEVKGRSVLVVDDILDEGHTLSAVKSFLNDAQEIQTAVLVEKLLQKVKPCKAEFRGFTVQEGQFIVGSGMDYNGWGRNLPGIWEVEC